MPREWILKKDRFEVSPNHYESYQMADGEWVVGDGKEVRVIEYSAYNQVVYELEKARADRTKAENERDELKALIRESAEQIYTGYPPVAKDEK